MEILTPNRKTKLKTALLRNLAGEVWGISHPVGVISVFILSDFLLPVLLHPAREAICLKLRQPEPADLQRKVTFRMYPCATEIRALNKSALAHCKIYNTLLEVSRLRHKAGLQSFTRTTVCDAVKAIRNTHAWIEEATTAQSVQVTGQRLVRAFENFFARVAKGQTPGYPRFKSSKKYPGWGYKTYGDGWSLLEQKSKTSATGKVKHGYSAVRISGVGNVQIRGAARFLGIPKTAEVIRKNDKWYLSVTVDVAHASIARQAGHASMAFDWGVNTLLTQVVGDPMTGAVNEVENPRWLKKQLTLIARVQRFIAEMETAAKKSSGKDKHFPVCHLLKNAYARRRSIYKRIAAQRHDFYHQLTAKLIAQFGLIVTEELAIKNMTKSPKPKEDPDQPGQYLPNGAAAKGGLNRSILDSAPGMLLAQLNYKASEADGRLQYIPTKKVKPTQRCHCCGVTTKLTLKERQWTCSCGVHHLRDVNAPRTMLRYAYEGAWWENDSNESGQELAGSHEAARNFIQVGSPIWVE